MGTPPHRSSDGSVAAIIVYLPSLVRPCPLGVKRSTHCTRRTSGRACNATSWFPPSRWSCLPQRRDV